MGWDYRRNVTAILTSWALQKVLGNYCGSMGRIQSDMVEMHIVDQKLMTLMPKKSSLQTCNDFWYEF